MKALSASSLSLGGITSPPFKILTLGNLEMRSILFSWAVYSWSNGMCWSLNSRSELNLLSLSNSDQLDTLDNNCNYLTCSTLYFDRVYLVVLRFKQINLLSEHLSGIDSTGHSESESISSSGQLRFSESISKEVKGLQLKNNWRKWGWENTPETTHM